jgi:hypothetical protein
MADKLPPPAPWRHVSDVAREVLRRILAAKKRNKAANDG